MTTELVPIIPAVDVLGSEAVRLDRGDFGRVVTRAGDPVEVVRRFAEARPPFVHVVDLAGARDGRLRPRAVAALVAAAEGVPVQASGGVRSVADALALVRAGVTRVVVGTAAFAAPDAVGPYVDALADRLVVAVDVRDGRIATAGWRLDAELTVDEAVRRATAAGVQRLLCTSIVRDGTLLGPDLPLLERVVAAAGVPVLAAGGVRSVADLRALTEVGVEAAVVGRAVLEGRLSLRRRAA